MRFTKIKQQFVRLYAPRCHVCRLAIRPQPGQEETVRVVALEKSFHVDCYICKVSVHICEEL